MAIKQGRLNIFCQSKSMESILFVANSFGASTAIFVTKDCTPQAHALLAKHRYPMGLHIPNHFSIFGFQTSNKVLELQGALGRGVEV